MRWCPFEISGPRELTGAVDLISHYKLLPHYEYFCKRSLPLSIADTHYLHNVVGDTEIRKGEGMQLDQLIQNTSRDSNARIQPFDLNVLREAFQLKETTPIDLPSKRKHDGDEDLNDVHKHKKSKHKSSKIDEIGVIKVEMEVAKGRPGDKEDLECCTVACHLVIMVLKLNPKDARKVGFELTENVKMVNSPDKNIWMPGRNLQKMELVSYSFW
ncbi:hypothetical protein POTOM_033696 [Populus tomentosa]|uniref:Uncharacterized protein n=1 Tax=Populus tomentosa TaxID=118781 RepID=A0A8X8CQW7_POPTO|nr:hypothetical protein POTOM_033696 [Populus tomentosa]